MWPALWGTWGSGSSGHRRTPAQLAEAALWRQQQQQQGLDRMRTAAVLVLRLAAQEQQQMRQAMAPVARTVSGVSAMATRQQVLLLLVLLVAV